LERISITLNFDYAQTETMVCATTAANRGRPRILVVDDYQFIRDLIVPILFSAGFDCREAANGRAAMDLLASGTRINLVLSNLLLPEVDGWMLFQHVKQNYSRIPFAFVTTVHNPWFREEAIKEHVDGFLLMPFEREELLKTVRMALGSRTPFLAEKREKRGF
jgi:two-component system chemotaxis response regulator CheY